MIEASTGIVVSPAPGQVSVRMLTVTSLAAVLLWDTLGLDMALAHAFGGTGGFPLREHWLLTDVLHDGVRIAAWLLALTLCLGVWWPFGVLRRVNASRRLQLAVTVLAASLFISLLKGASGTSCPWDLQAFGGVAHPVPHWLGWWRGDGGGGHCFPAGHASSGFAFVGGWFAFRAHPRLARGWLLSALAAGLLFGLAQQARGAHFMSHTLWTAWLCWVAAAGIDSLWPMPGADRSLS